MAFDLQIPTYVFAPNQGNSGILGDEVYDSSRGVVRKGSRVCSLRLALLSYTQGRVLTTETSYEELTSNLHFNLVPTKHGNPCYLA